MAEHPRQKCNSCKWYSGNELEGMCRRRPPVLVEMANFGSDMPFRNERWDVPCTVPQNGCGEWQTEGAKPIPDETCVYVYLGGGRAQSKGDPIVEMEDGDLFVYLKDHEEALVNAQTKMENP